MVDDNDATQGEASAGTEEAKPKGFSPVIKKPGAVEIGAAPGKLLSPAAKRALQEAAARRKASDISDSDRSDETARAMAIGNAAGLLTTFKRRSDLRTLFNSSGCAVIT